MARSCSSSERYTGTLHRQRQWLCNSRGKRRGTDAAIAAEANAEVQTWQSARSPHLVDGVDCARAAQVQQAADAAHKGCCRQERRKAAACKVVQHL